MHEISEVTRRGIVDFFTSGNINWAGRLSDHDFLARLYDLTKLPSTDRRYRNASADILQHCSWNDWQNDWVFYDSRFNILHAPDEEFLEFLCETVHPVVRPDENEVRHLVDNINDHLAKDGWKLVKKTEISGKPVYAARQIEGRAEIFEEPTGWEKIDRQLQETRLRLDEAQSEEQFQAVGLICRETLISVAQEVYNAKSHSSLDGIVPSQTDAARMLDAYFASELSGAPNADIRSCVKAVLKLSVALQHKRTADFRMAALCAEATVAVINVVSIVSGRRD